MSAAPMPEEVRALLPLAHLWGSPDDVDRSMKLENASPRDLRELVEQVKGAGPNLYAWLEASSDDLSDPDFVAVTSLTMAADEARVILRNLER